VKVDRAPVFRPVNRHDTVQAAERAGLAPVRCADYSLRSGLATAAAAGGAPERAIMRQTGHRSVGMVRRYIRAGSLFQETAAAYVGLEPSVRYRIAGRQLMTDPNAVATIRATRRKLAADGPCRVRSPGDFDRVSLPQSDGDALRDMLIAERPRVVIEIGLAYGASALAIAEALVAIGSDRSRHLIIDAYQQRFGTAGWDAMVETGLTGLCSLVEERSQIVLPRLLTEGLVADAAFVDGSHIFHNVFVDLYYLRELIRPGGLVILDDCNYASVATAARYFELNTEWTPQPTGGLTRLRSFRTPNPRMDPSFERFRPFGLDTTGEAEMGSTPRLA
jgi:predicted O-methyltransferase YrrM